MEKEPLTHYYQLLQQCSIVWDITAKVWRLPSEQAAESHKPENSTWAGRLI